MDENEAALLAELRAISNRSAAAARFQEDDNGPAATNDEAMPPSQSNNADVSHDLSFVSAKSSSSMDQFEDAVTGSAKKTVETPGIPPWKSDKKTMNDNDASVDIVVAAPPAPSPKSMQQQEESQVETRENVQQQQQQQQSFGIKSLLPSTCQGDRGGAAEDEELLAELRAISQKSSSADRVADEDDIESGGATSTFEPRENAVASSSQKDTVESKSPTLPKTESMDLPPWKRGKKKSAKPSPVEVDVVVAAPPASATEVLQSDESEKVPQSLGIKSSLPSTFQGDRGGAAEDAELLAELRAISQQSASTDRLAKDSNEIGGESQRTDSAMENVVAPPNKKVESAARPSPRTKAEPDELPPWKRGKKKTTKPESVEVDVLVAAPPAPVTEAAAQSDESHNATQQNFGIKDSLPSTFTGDRGGAAEDAELLAELRAISQQSSSADQFAKSGNDGDEAPASMPVEHVVAPPKKAESSAACPSPKESKPEPDELPPRRRKKKKATKPQASVEVDVVVAAPPHATESKPVPSDANESVPQPLGIKSSLPSTFQGERGGAAEDEELLAELRAISQKSSSVDRFVESSDANEVEATTSMPVEDVVGALSARDVNEGSSHSEPSSGAPKAKAKSPLPPWNRGKKKAAESPATEVDVVVAAPRPPSHQSEPSPFAVSENTPQPLGIKSSLPSTFQGDRGGTAEDAELLAELRAISQKSSSTDRFAEDIRDNVAESSTSEAVIAGSSEQNIAQSASRPHSSPEASKVKAKSPMLPPWKRGKKKAAESPAAEVDVVVAAPRPPSHQTEPSPSDVSESAPQPLGIKSSLPSTFQGDRGGTAEDEELLAELRAISAKSSSTDRFAEDGNGGVTNTPEQTEEVIAVPKKVDADSTSSLRLPTKESSSKPKVLPPWKRGKKKSRDPTAVDVDVVVAAPAPPPESVPLEANQNDAPQTLGIQSSLPSTFQGERGGPAEDAELLAELRAVSGGIKSDLPNTFKGERGGAAEDADLLAELRAISSNSSAGKRPSTDEPSGAAPASSNKVAQLPVAEKPTASPLPSRSAPSTSTAPPSPAADAAVESSVTRESLPSFVTDKSWKLRKEAYALLRTLLADRLKNGEGNGSIHGDTLMPDLDDALPSMVSDKNAGALDTALAFAVDYAEHCNGASSSELAAKIVASTIKGGALSSSKPSTTKSASALALKLMEVGDDGYASVHAVSEVLLSQGLSSRKPKIVISSSGLILQAAYDFGAGSLPLAAISSAAPKMLSHSNATVRETGLKIIAEICRALKSKGPLQGLIDGMKKAQQTQLESLLEAQPEPTPIGVGLRSMKGSNSSQSPADALAALESGAKELEAKRFAEREPVNLLQALPKTDYSTRIKLAKWSEKVGALDIALEVGGEKPYKLVQPSSSVNYSPLISEMKGLLSHSHFAVASKAMKVLSMLAEGVGSGLFPHLRPLLGQLILLSKDKKLNRAVNESLDIFFGNVLEIDHLLDKDDALPSVLNEKVQKNALVRATALDFLGRCIKRGESAGPRGRVTSKSAAAVARLCCEKLEDSDASVRKAATESLRCLLSVEDAAITDEVSPIIESLQTKNSRAYKSLMGGGGAGQRRAGPSGTASAPKSRASGSRRTQPGPAKSSPQAIRKVSRPSPIEQTATKPAAGRSRPVPSSSRATSAPETVVEDSSDAPSLEEAISVVASIHIPSWGAPDDDGGVFAGLKSSKWLLRQNAVLNLAAFNKTEESPVGSSEGVTAALVVLVKEHTKGFKETNVNVTKAIMELFISLSQAHAAQGRPFPTWASKDGVKLSVDKIADKKLSALSCKLLSELCCVCSPQGVLEYGIVCIDKVKSPLGHEAFLKWFKDFLTDFGATFIVGALKNVSPWLVKECETSNPKVRKMALSVAGELHLQLGPVARALILSSCDDAGSVKSQLERAFDENPFDAAAAKMERSRACVVLQSNNASGSNDAGAASSTVLLDIPKLDLQASLSSDCIKKMGCKEGKNAWKMRKQALDDVEAAVGKSNGLISTDAMKPLVELLRVLRERLSDSQSNLKPVAARTIGSILGSVDSVSQAKLGKIAFAPLVSAVMNDNRKPMREASLEAIRKGTTASSVEGCGPNSASLESLMVAVVGELSESEFKAGGLPDMLVFITEVAEYLPNLDSIASARAQTLGDKFAAVMVACLTSSKSETRSAAEKLLKACIENEKLSLASVKKGMKNLLPAQQRTVIPIVARLPHPAQPGSPSGGKENSVPSPPRGMSRQRKPREATTGAGTASSPPQRRAVPSRRTQGGPKRESTQANDSFEMDAGDYDDLHPLVANGEPGKKPLPSSRRINWPLHPEEPNSPMQINALKKLWSRSLPTRSVAALFPPGGIKKQEDAMAGCALLCKAIEKDRAGKEEAIVDHVDVIFMWISFALCSRESTVGLQPLITLLTRLFSFLEDHQYKLSDGEAYILLPHVFEKASISKGRFREQFNNVISSFRSDVILSTRSLGQVVCVPLIEHSHQSKTRVLALHECRTCVERVGLSGLGKKGLLVTAKALSEESLPENRTAALDLLETVLAKMDGDIDKLASICGTEYLSDKGRAMIEERWKKHSGSHQSLPQKTIRNDRSRRQSQIPSSRAAMGASRSSRRKPPPIDESYDVADRSPDTVKIDRASTEGLRDELPSLKLEIDDRISTGVTSRHAESSSALPATGPFTFSFTAPEPAHQDSEPVHFKDEVAQQDAVLRRAGGTTSYVQKEVSSGGGATSSGSGETTEGAAASLRARLLKIRQKQSEESVAQKQREESVAPDPQAPAPSVPPQLSPPDLSSPLTEPPSEPIVEAVSNEMEERRDISENSYEILHACIEELLHTKPPVPEAHPRLRDCTAALKKYHAVISNQPGAAPDMSQAEFSDLRQNITDKTVESIENLTSVVVFAFNCEFPENTAGMSIPLLSVALATLMALFRDKRLSLNVTQDALALLIREAAKALLDPRLAVSSHHAMTSQLDESTSSQMVRAINKLAVQAATGSPRDVSIEALLALQLQLCTVGNETAADAAFNSRLSRIVTKLFAKVLKAEAASAEPFSPETVDMEAVICALEDMLVATSFAPGAPNRNRQDAVETCSNMGRSLLIPIFNARGEGGIEEFRAMMDELGIHSRDSKLGLLVTSCESEIDFSTKKVEMQEAPVPPAPASPSRPPSMTVASLVSELGSAPEGPERVAAAAALRRYNELHGKAELRDHLRDVSETFRSYIMEQLEESSSLSTPERRAVGEANGQSMSERIRLLRSKLNATEAAVQSAVEPTETAKPTVETEEQTSSAAASSQPTTPSRSRIPGPSTPRRSVAGEARLTPSRIPKTSSSAATTSQSTTALSLRERLAAAQKSRASKAAAAAESSESFGADALGAGRSSTSAYGHAAALRARLEAVKQQSKRDIS